MAVQKKYQKKKPSSAKKKTKKKGLTDFRLFVIVLLCIVAFVIYYYFYYRPQNYKVDRSQFLRNIPEGFQSVGIDISHHQGKIDFDRLFVKERYDTLISWVYCKATEGEDFIDKNFENFEEELNDLKIPNGAYHFFNPRKPPRTQAAHFIKISKVKTDKLPPVLDVETEGFSDKDLIDKMHIWLTVVEAETGCRPIIYTSLYFYETKFKGQFPSHQFWIAAYTRKPSVNDPNIIHWQYTDKGELPGIREKVDLNVSKVNY